MKFLHFFTVFIVLVSINIRIHGQTNDTDSIQNKWKALCKEANNCLQKRQIKKAKDFALQSDSIYRIYNNNKPYSSAHSLLAICYKDLGDLITAHQYYQNALDNATNPVSRVLTALNMAELGGVAGDTLMAIQQFTDNFETVKNHFKPKEKAYCYNGFANILMHYNYNSNQIKIPQLYDSAFHIYEKESEYESAGFAALNFSNYYADINKEDSVTYWINKAYEMQLKSQSPLGMADVLLGLAKYHEDRFVKDSALFYYKEALNYSLKSNYIPFIEEDYKGLAVIYEQLRQYDLSSKYYKLYYSLKDSLQREDWRTQLSKMQIEYDVKNKNKKIKELAKSLSTFKYKHTILTILSVLLIVIISAVFVKWNNSKQFVQTKNNRKAIKPSTKHFSSEKLKIWNQLQDLITNEKVYLNQEITLSSLAKELNTNRTTLSEIINEKSEKTFNQFINQYRIEEAARLLNDPKMMHLTIEGIAQETGFKSRSSFYTAFTNEKGITPSNYRKQINTEVLV